MKNAQEAIERVLAGLRDAEPSPGFERRIMAAVKEQSRMRTAATSQWAWRIATVGLIVLVPSLAVIVTHRHGHPSTQAQQHMITPGPLPSAGSAPDRQEVPLPPHQPVAAVGRPARTAARARNVRQIDAADAALLRDMRAPSHPAPEMPLTGEEKLLLRVVHLRDPQVMAMLNPEVRARQETENEAEFQRFVDQSGKGDSE